MYDLWRVGGDAAVGASSAVAFALAFGMLAVLLMRRGAAPVGALLALGGALVQCLLFAETRAQSYAYPLFVGLLWIVLTQSDRTWLRRAALTLPLLVLWANVHGSVLLGVAMVVACCGRSAAASLRRKAWRPAGGEVALSVLAAACVLATPYGTGMIGYYVRVLGDPALATIAEWQPSSFAPLNLPFVVILMGTLGLVCFARGRGVRLPADMLLLAVLLGALAAHAVRYQTWFALGAAPLLALAVTRTWSRRRGLAPPPRVIVIAAGALLLVFTVVAGGILARTPSSAYGKWISDSAVHSAARYGAEHPQARILADDVTGSALLWRYPSLAGRVGFDARTEIYKPSQFLAFARFVLASGPTWAASARPVPGGRGHVPAASRPVQGASRALRLADPHSPRRWHGRRPQLSAARGTSTAGCRGSRPASRPGWRSPPPRTAAPPRPRRAPRARAGRGRVPRGSRRESGRTAGRRAVRVARNVHARLSTKLLVAAATNAKANATG